MIDFHFEQNTENSYVQNIRMSINMRRSKERYLEIIISPKCLSV